MFEFAEKILLCGYIHIAQNAKLFKDEVCREADVHNSAMMLVLLA